MYYLAVTYDLCIQNDLCESMSEYELDPLKEIEGQVKQFAEKDIAPLVKVYLSETKLVKEYLFEEYDCHCTTS